MSTRYRMTVEYHGGPMVGFQRQTNGMSVQQALEDAFAKFCGHEVRIFGSGRTDAGVHAEGQVVHVDLEEPIAARTIMGAANFHMKPLPVAVLDCEEVSSDFHARFDAIARHYRYLIINRRAPLALDKGLAWHVPQALDSDAMHEAALAVVVVEGVVPGASVVPERHRPLAPGKAQGAFGYRRVLVEKFEQCEGFRRRPTLYADRESRIHVEHATTGVGVADDHGVDDVLGRCIGIPEPLADIARRAVGRGHGLHPKDVTARMDCPQTA